MDVTGSASLEESQINAAAWIINACCQNHPVFEETKKAKSHDTVEKNGLRIIPTAVCELSQMLQ